MRRLYLTFLQDELTSHRELREIVELKPWQRFWQMLLSGEYHAASLHRFMLVAVAASLVLLWGRFEAAERRLLLVLVASAFLISANYAFFYAPWSESARELMPFLSAFDVRRFYWLLPLIWALAFFLALRAIARVPRLGVGLASFAILFQVYLSTFVVADHETARNDLAINLRHITKDAVGIQDEFRLTFQTFYSEALFSQVRDYIDRPQQDYRVISVGFHPAVAQYNGFYTLDSYQNNYPADYHGAFREIIAAELEKNEDIRVYFDQWGNRCYAFVASLGRSVMPLKALAPIDDLEFDLKALAAMGGEYILSGYEIVTDRLPNLRHVETFTHPDLPWTLYLYQVVGLDDPPPQSTSRPLATRAAWFPSARPSATFHSRPNV